MNVNTSLDIDDETPMTVSFPLPFRVLVLVGLGILGWATNLHGLDLLGVDVVTAMDLRLEGNHPVTPLPAHRPAGSKSTLNSFLIYRPVYRLFLAYSTWCFSQWLLYRFITRGDITLVDAFWYIPWMCALFIVLALICPFDVLHKRERDKFLHSIRRCLFVSMDGPIFFADVVFADIFTSFAKVLGDVWLCMCMLLPGNSLLIPPAEEGWAQWVMPTIMSLPYAVRLRQCVIEYSLPTNDSRRPLFNALKYATAFPVIYLSAAQRTAAVDLAGEKGVRISEQQHGEHHLFRLWLFAAALNSLYSFWWDVTNDWGLELLQPRSTNDSSMLERPPPPRRLVLPRLHSSVPLLGRSPTHPPSPSEENVSSPGIDSGRQPRRPYPYGLRPKLLYPLPVYPLLVFLNLVLRLTWSIKLSSHLHSKTDGSVAIFWLEMAEVLRRWMWVFIRVEWEIIKKTQEPHRVWLEDLSGDESDYEMIPPITEQDLSRLPSSAR